jgi:transcriptional regulator with XRE-family HTH domain
MTSTAPLDAGTDGAGSVWLSEAHPEPEAAAALRRHTLGSFLRSRRERIDPRDVGLPAGGRRRTPGLRREEVAQLAGVGVTWYTWLEQGRDINASEQVLDAVARTLMLDAPEREHLFVLANQAGPDLAADGGYDGSLPATVQTILDELDPVPACAVSARLDILAFNRVYGAVIEDLTTMPREERNLVWLAFTHPVWRAAIVDWEDSVRHTVAQLRAAMADHVAEPAWKSLIRRLKLASPEFASMWARHEVHGPENRTKVLLSPRVGLLRLDLTNLWCGPRMTTRIATYTPADDLSRARLDELAALLSHTS